VPIGLRGEIKMPVAGHDDVQLILHGRDGKLVGRIEARLRGDDRPRADARILLGEDGSSRGDSKEDKRTNWAGEIDGINVADSFGSPIRNGLRNVEPR
jgi:hypothetical protein